MRIPVTIYTELKKGDIFKATIDAQKGRLVAELNIYWERGTPYHVTVQTIS